MKILYFALAMLFLSALYSSAQTSFTLDADSGCAPFTVHFTNTSNQGVYYAWSMDGGNTWGEAVDTVVTFTEGGYTYPMLASYDEYYQFIGSFYDTLYTGIGVYDFTVPRDSVCPGEEASFQIEYNSYIDVNLFSWNFGNETTSESENSFYEYQSYYQTGLYFVTLIANTGCNVDTIVHTVYVGDQVPVSQSESINIYPVLSCPGDMVYLSPNYYQYESYFWDFGDGTIGTDADGNHFFSDTGQYLVSLTLTNYCSLDRTFIDTVTISSHVPFQYIWEYVSPQKACPGENINFSVERRYSYYLWDFGDGNYAYEPNPVYYYESLGTYPVSVSVENGCGVDTTLYDTVFISDDLPVLYCYLSASPEEACPGDYISFSASSGFAYYYWDFGDGETSGQENISHAYINTGDYLITLQVSNLCGNDTTLYKTIHVAGGLPANADDYDVDAFSYNSCPNEPLLFYVWPSTGFSNWDFGDGSSSSVTELVWVDGYYPVDFIQHTYSQLGDYVVTATVTNGCGNSFTTSIPVSIGNFVEVDGDFWWDGGENVSVGVPVNFYGSGGMLYEWNFGDGTAVITDSLSFPDPVVHTYTQPGNYTVSVTVYNSCGSSETLQYVISVEIDLTIATTNASCGSADGSATVTAVGGAAPFRYEWSNGDTTVTATNLVAGIYMITVTDAAGNSSFGAVMINNSNSADITETVTDVQCYGDNDGSISVTLSGGTPPYTCNWSNGGASTTITGLSAGPYELYVEDAGNCISVKSIMVGEPQPFVISLSGADTYCGYLNGAATATCSGGTPPYSYEWFDCSADSTVTGLGAGAFFVDAYDANECSAHEEFSINESGAASITIDSVTNTTCGSYSGSIYITVDGGSAPYTFGWSNGYLTQNLTGVNPGTYHVTVTDATGCKSVTGAEISNTTPQASPICVVTVDSASGKNLIVWERPLTNGIASYNIYKESTQSGVYYQVGSRPYDSLSVFVDYLSNPLQRSWKYKLSAVDVCGAESPLSDAHKTIHLTVNQGLNNMINLIWDKYEGFPYLSYYIYRYSQADGWEVIDSIQSTAFMYTDFPTSTTRLWYIVSVDRGDLCSPAVVDKTQTGPYSQSVSNIDDNKVAGTITENYLHSGIVIYPNPFNDNIALALDLQRDTRVVVTVTDIAGRQTGLVTDRRLGAGSGTLTFSTGEFLPGIYFVKIQAGSEVSVEKMVKLY